MSSRSLWQRSITEWMHGVLWILSAAFFWLFSFGGFDERLALMLLGICLVTFFFRLAGLFRIYPMFVFALICSKFYFSQPIMTDAERRILGMSTLITIALGSRLHTIQVPEHQKVVTQSIAYAPTKLKPRDTYGIASYLVALMTLVIAWFVAGYLNSEFAWATENTTHFQQYRRQLRNGIRLVPWAYNGIRLTIYLGVAFAVTRGILSYLRCRNNEGKMGAMLLRHELWKWNRWEQKAVAKAAREYS